jgi:acyl carrier protein
VVGLPHEVQGEEVAAAVVLRSQVGTQALREFVAQRLAAHKVPVRIAVVDTIPRNQSGKPLKRQLRAQLLRGPVVRVSQGEGNPLWQQVAAIWAGVLDLDEVDPDADLLELGASSLLATQLSARVRRVFGVELSVGEILQRRTLTQLVALVEAATGGASGRRPAAPPKIPRLPRPSPS